jgi:protein-S-isoprenylcysteine O-methyltransferase Ste14
LVGYGILVEILVVWLCIAAPAGLEARFKIKSKDKKRPKEDKILTPLLVIFILALFIVIPVDVFYLHLLPKPGPLWSIVGVVLIVFGLLFNVGSIYANAFITPTIQDQTDEGQKVADTGVYSVVRHPFYSSLILFFGGITIWLESWVGVIALLPILVVMILRIRVEERTLKATLPGYPKYMKKVKYRLLPFVW